MSYRETFETVRQKTFSGRQFRGHVVMPIEAWVVLEKLFDAHDAIMGKELSDALKLSEMESLRIEIGRP